MAGQGDAPRRPYKGGAMQTKCSACVEGCCSPHLTFYPLRPRAGGGEESFGSLGNGSQVDSLSATIQRETILLSLALTRARERMKGEGVGRSLAPGTWAAVPLPPRTASFALGETLARPWCVLLFVRVQKFFPNFFGKRPMFCACPEILAQKFSPAILRHSRAVCFSQRRTNAGLPTS